MLLLAAAAAIAVAAGPARAQGQSGKLDLSTILCRELPDMKPEQVEQVVTWMLGFYTEEQDPRVIDPEKIKAGVGKLQDYCKANPQANLVAAGDDAIYEERAKPPAAPAPAPK